METARTIDTMRLVGGHACLDFANTVDARRDRWGPDLLQSFADLVSWAERVGLVEAHSRAELLASASRRPLAAQEALERAKVLREALYALLHAEATGGALPTAALQTFANSVASASADRELVGQGGQLAWGWKGRSGLDAVSHRVAFAAAEFMVNRNERRAVRECTGPNCGWLFLDSSRGGRRRWCSDETCGTHSRVRRFRERAVATAKQGQ